MSATISLTFSDYLQIFAISIPIITLIVGWFLDRADSRRQFRRNRASKLYEEFLVSINKCRLHISDKNRFYVNYDKAKLLQVRLSIWANNKVSNESKKMLESVRDYFFKLESYWREKADLNRYDRDKDSDRDYTEDDYIYIDYLESIDWAERKADLAKSKEDMYNNYNYLSEEIINDLRK